MDTYRDIGRVEGGSAALIAADPTYYSQVFKATHDGDGNRLPFRNRSFISFSFGGKWIEDYGFIVVSDGTKYSRPLYAEFAHNITQLDTVDGQIYWSTHYNANSLALTLATDGVRDDVLEEFKRWFAPHNQRELILAEHPNRGIIAHIASVPTFNTYVVKQEVTTKIGGIEYTTETTLHRGNITLEFEMDEPFWHSTSNIMCYIEEDDDVDYDKWLNANNVATYALEDKDAIKVLLEDGVPINSMIKMNDMHFGNGLIASDDENSRKTLVGTDGDSSYADISPSAADTSHGRIGPLLIAPSEDSVFDSGIANAKYYYYAGTAPCAPTIYFTLTPIVDDNGYITSPYNSYDSSTNYNYNTIFVQSENLKEFRFTTPGIWTGYNQVIDILTGAGEGVAWTEIRELIRDNVKHYAPRAYGIKVIEDVKGNTINTTSELLATAIEQMKLFLYDANEHLNTMKCMINCKTGQTSGEIAYRTVDDSLISIEENIGDMVRSDYLKIEERNFPSPEGYIEQWKAATPTYSHRVYHNVPNGLIGFKMEYKYLYL